MIPNTENMIHNYKILINSILSKRDSYTAVAQLVRCFTGGLTGGW